MNKRKANAQGTVPSPLSWGLFTFDPHGMSEAHLRRFTGMLLDTAKRQGLSLGAPTVMQNIQLSHPREILNMFENTQKRTNIELLFIGIPSRHERLESDTIYKKVKVYGEFYPRIKTQCFRTEKARVIPPGFFDAIVLKVKNKIGQERGSFLDAASMQILFDAANEPASSKTRSPPPATDRFGYLFREVTFQTV